MVRQRRNLSDDVAADLRDRILSGQLKPGTKLPQDELARQLEVSKVPVREALVRLEAEGIVKNIPRRGTFVADLTREDVLDAYTIYALISALAAKRAALRIEPEAIAQLQDLARSMEKTNDTEYQSKLNTEFHSIINRAGGSRRLRATLKTLSRSLPTNFFGVKWHWSEHAHGEHQMIIAALLQHDESAAHDAMFDHLQQSGEHAVYMLQKEGFWEDQQP